LTAVKFQLFQRDLRPLRYLAECCVWTGLKKTQKLTYESCRMADYLGMVLLCAALRSGFTCATLKVTVF